MKLEDFKVGMKVRNINGSLISEVIGITTTGTVTLLFQGSEYVRRNYNDYTPYVEKKRIKAYHYIYSSKFDLDRILILTSQQPWPANNRLGLTVHKEWEEEIEYEVKD